ncbi:MAG: ABC transporter permease [Anaerolineae bacterium]
MSEKAETGRRKKAEKEKRERKGTSKSLFPFSLISLFPYSLFPFFPFSLNPVIIKELRSRMRGGRAFAILTAFLLTLSFVSYGLYRIAGVATRFEASGLVSAMIGQTLFAGLAFLELFLVLFITPALTAGTVSGEHENLTYEMLVATPLKPRTILWGKLVSAMSYVLLLIFAAIPLASLVFIFGGVAPADALKALLMLVVTAVTFGAVGLFFSSLTGRTARATVLSYSFLLLVSIGTLFMFVLWGIIQNTEPPRAILFLNPFSGMASVLAEATPQGRFGLVGIPFGLLAGDLRVFSGGSPGPAVVRPTWHYTMALYAALTVTLYLVSTQLVKPIRRWRIGRLGAAAVVVLLLLFGVGGYVLFKPLAGEAEGIAVPTPAPLIGPAPPVMIERAVPFPYPPPYPPPPTPTPAEPPPEDAP